MAGQAPPMPESLKLSGVEHAQQGGRGGDYDALTELFLGPAGTRTRSGAATGGAALGDAGETRRSAGESGEVEAAVAPAAIEGLILGHLPVMGWAWAMQYARWVVEEGGSPVAVLRLRAEECTIEVVGGGEGRAASSFGEGLGRAAGVSRHWLIAVDGAWERALVEQSELDGLTLLCGADEAATVAAYRTVKALFAPDGSEDGPGESMLHAPIRVVIMGAARERAWEARAALVRAVESFLRRTLEIAEGPQRIAGGGGAPWLVYRGPALAMEEAVAPLRKALSQPRGSAGVGAGQSPQRVELERQLVQIMEEAAAGGPGEKLPETAVPMRASPVIAMSESAVPLEAGAGTQGAGDASGGSPSLAEHLGMARVPAQCPYARGVELAVDDEGALHLLAEMGRGDEAVRSLLTAAAWASVHAPLLRLASARLGAGPQQPMLHLFTSDARAVRHLGETGVRLHLLAAVGGGWFCTELN
jgi:hypothetical protein